jgi:hypothetical protein
VNENRTEWLRQRVGEKGWALANAVNLEQGLLLFVCAVL